MWECVRAGHIEISAHGSRQSCPFVSGESASTVRNDGKIVLLVHCESWIACIRANKIVANLLHLFLSLPHSSLSLFPSYHTSSRSVLHSRRLRAVPLRLRPSHLSLLVPSISSHILSCTYALPLPPPAVPYSRPLGSRRPCPFRKRAFYNAVYVSTSEARKAASGLYGSRCKLARPGYWRDPGKRYEARPTTVNCR